MQKVEAAAKKPVRTYDDEPLLLEAMKALTHKSGRIWLRERGGFEPDHMDVRKVTARDYKALVACVDMAVRPRPEV